MDVRSFYNSAEWRALRDHVKERDGRRCTVARLFGGRCSRDLHAHHIEDIDSRPDLALDEDNVATVCSIHHPIWESLRRSLIRIRNRDDERIRCPHVHRTRFGREECERRRARALGVAA